MSSVANIALVPRGVKVDMSEVANVAAALSIQIVRDFGPIWGISATVSAFPKAVDVPVGYWPIYIEDPFKLPDGATGCHLDSLSQPYALVETGEHWSLDASHECMEMLVDPSGNRLLAGPMLDPAIQLGMAQHQVRYVVEVCDPVQDGQYGYQINGVLVSDFFTPNFYDPARAGGVRYDFVGALDGPLQVATNGSMAWLDPVTSDAMQLQNFMGPDCRLHPQVVNLSRSNMFQEVLAKEALRPAIDRVTVVPNLLAALSREQHVVFETRYRSVRHASQMNARRMQEDVASSIAFHEELLGACLSS
jgi:hypothetical protein